MEALVVIYLLSAILTLVGGVLVITRVDKVDYTLGDLSFAALLASIPFLNVVILVGLAVYTLAKKLPKNRVIFKARGNRQ